jgi:hypothetical protein
LIYTDFACSEEHESMKNDEINYFDPIETSSEISSPTTHDQSDSESNSSVESGSFVMNRKGNKQLLHKGFAYNMMTVGNETRWRCKIRACTGKAKYVNGIVTTSSKHSHAPSAATKLCSNFASKIRIQARSSLGSTRELMLEITRNLTPNEAVIFPNRHAITQQIRKIRKTQNSDGLNESSENNFPSVPLKYQKTSSGDNFLLRHNTIVVFASPIALKFLGQSTHWFVDGTFKVSPSDFAQVWKKIQSKKKLLIFF